MVACWSRAIRRLGIDGSGWRVDGSGWYGTQTGRRSNLEEGPKPPFLTSETVRFGRNGGGTECPCRVVDGFQPKPRPKTGSCEGFFEGLIIFGGPLVQSCQRLRSRHRPVLRSLHLLVLHVSQIPQNPIKPPTRPKSSGGSQRRRSGDGRVTGHGTSRSKQCTDRRSTSSLVPVATSVSKGVFCMTMYDSDHDQVQSKEILYTESLGVLSGGDQPLRPLRRSFVARRLSRKTLGKWALISSHQQLRQAELLWIT